MASSFVYETTHTARPINNKVIKHQKSFALNPATQAGTVYFICYLNGAYGHLKPASKLAHKYWFISYINFWTDDLSFTNALANRQDYPYLSITGNQWTDYPADDVDKLPLVLEENNSALSVPAQFRVKNLYLGKWALAPKSQNFSIGVTYDMTIGKIYRLQVEFLESLVPLGHPQFIGPNLY